MFQYAVCWGFSASFRRPVDHLANSGDYESDRRSLMSCSARLSWGQRDVSRLLRCSVVGFALHGVCTFSPDIFFLEASLFIAKITSKKT